jgi:hypothetical protein
MRRAATSVLLSFAISCGSAQRSVRSSGFSTSRAVAPSSVLVRVSATRDPAKAQELGVAEAHGTVPAATLDALISEFRARVASMGGDYGRIDTLGTRHEMVTETYTFDCSTTETVFETRSVSRVNPDGSVSFTTEAVPVTQTVSKTCTEERQVEVATMSVVGRAFRTVGEDR